MFFMTASVFYHRSRLAPAFYGVSRFGRPRPVIKNYPWRGVSSRHTKVSLVSPYWHSSPRVLDWRLGGDIIRGGVWCVRCDAGGAASVCRVSAAPPPTHQPPSQALACGDA